LTLIIDSYAWLEFLTAGPLGPKVRFSLESSEHLVTPDVVLPEVARTFGRAGEDAEVIRGHLRSVSALSTVRGIDEDVAVGVIGAARDLREHAKLRRLGQPSFADAIVLAFARALDGRVLTGDPHFSGLDETEWVGR
jgi:predicted nucleic acid-binding protein